MPQRRVLIFFATLALVIAACSRAPAPPPIDPRVAAQAANEAAASQEAVLYDQMRASHSWDLASTLGNEALDKYPGTVAAAKVQQTIVDVRAKAEQQAQARRLARLWVYTATAEAGGTQYAAAIPSKEALGPADARIRLVLRQHPKWGQSVYLLLDNAKFDCSKGCASLPVSFDATPALRMKATIPPTGEPALFIDDDKRFIARMEKGHTVAIGVNIRGVGEKTVVFEVGGYNPAKLPGVPEK